VDVAASSGTGCGKLTRGTAGVTLPPLEVIMSRLPWKGRRSAGGRLEGMTMWFRGVGLSLTCIVSLLAAPLIAEAQQAGPVHRIGLLHPFSPPPPSASDARAEALRQGLHDLGYVEGQNLVMEIRYAAGSEERLPDLAAELVQRKVDVIVAPGGAASRAAQHA